MFKKHPIEIFFKNKAKKIKKQNSDISLMQAQNLVAEMHGFNNWHSLKENINNIPFELRIPSKEEELEELYHGTKVEFQKYIYSTTKNIPSKGEVILGFNNNSNLNVWSSKETFIKHCLYFCQTKTRYHYDIISQFYKDNKSFILIDDDDKYINKIVCQNLNRKIINLNETKIKSPAIHSDEILNIILELYKLEYNNLPLKKLDILKQKMKESICYVFNSEEYLNMNKDLILSIKSRLEKIINDKDYQLENFFENMIQNFIYDDKGLYINLMEKNAYFIQCPLNTNKNYYYFNIFFSWFLTTLSIDYLHTGIEESENEHVYHKRENAGIFYFNPLFSDATYHPIIASKMRASGISLNYYVPAENAQRNSDYINYSIIPNVATILFERVNDNVSKVEEYFNDNLIKGHRRHYIKMDNGKKVLYSYW